MLIKQNNHSIERTTLSRSLVLESNVSRPNQSNRETSIIVVFPLAAWHRQVITRSPSGLDDLLADDAVFYSPVVHTPQRGKKNTAAYLSAAFDVLSNDTFRYVREIVGSRDAVLEFEVEIDGITVNGVDIIVWNDEGKIVEFKVMIRPLKAINLIHQQMVEILKSRSAIE